MIDKLKKMRKDDIKNIYLYIYMFFIIFLSRDSLISTTILGFTKSFILTMIISIPIFYEFIIRIRQDKCTKKSIYVLATLLISIIISMTIKLDFQPYSFSVLTIIIVAYIISYIYSYKKFLKIYSNVMISICIYSLITTYLIKPIIMQNNINFPIIINAANNAFYNFFFSFGLVSQYNIRNFAFFREPGVYQTFIIIALIFQLFYKETNCKVIIKVINILILTITIVSTFSTTGIVILGLTYLVYIVKLIEEKKLNKRNMCIILMVIVMGMIAVYIGYTKIPGFEYNIESSLEKIFTQNDSIKARKESIEIPLKMYLKSPIIGYSFVETVESIENNTNTTINMFNIYGILAGIISVILVVLFIKKLKQKRITTILLAIVFIIDINTQFLIGNIMLWVFMFSYFMEDENISEDDQNIEKKKILFLINTLSSGGAEKALIDIANNLDNKKFNITVQTLFNEGPYINQLNDNIKYKTIIKNTSTKLGNFLKRVLVKYIKKTNCIFLYYIFIKNDYDIEISFLEGMPTKIIGCTRNNNVKKIAWVHTDMLANFEAQDFFESFDSHKKSYLNYDKIICVSEDSRKQFKRRFEYNLENIVVQYNLLDKEKILKQAKNEVDEINFKEDTINICSVGRLVYAKGYDRLLKCIKRLLDEGYKINLYLIGEGELRNELYQYIEKYKLGEQIHLLGFKSNPYKYIDKCDIVISSSRYEGFSLVINETLIIGKVILATECTGPKELLENGKLGLLLENSENGIYEGIKKVLQNKELYNYYLNNVKSFSELYNKEEIVTEIEQQILN